MKVYLLWATYHKQDKDVLIAIYKDYSEAHKRLQELQINHYVEDIELYINESEIK